MDWFLAFPLVAVALGILAMALNGLPATIWLQNAIVCLACLTGCLFFREQPFSSFLDHARSALFLVAPLVRGLRLFAPGLDGVHRWLSIGSIRLHVASIFLPAFLAVIPAVVVRHRGRVLWFVLVVMGVLMIQPDASEATAFGAGLLAFANIRECPSIVRAVSIASTGTLVLVSWARPDPLPAIAHVEGVLELASRVHPAFAATGTIALAALPAPFLFFWHARRRNVEARGALAVAIYMFVKVWTAGLTGAFPIPLVGYGASPILGYFLALICAMGQAKSGGFETVLRNCFMSKGSEAKTGSACRMRSP